MNPLEVKPVIVITEEGEVEYGAYLYSLHTFLSAPTEDQLESMIAAAQRAYLNSQTQMIFSCMPTH